MTNEQLALEYYKLAKKGGELDTEHPGFSWRTVIFFYAALHAVDHALASLGKRPGNHDDRRTWVNNLPGLASVKGDYRTLEDLSQQARYHPDRCPLDLGEFRDARDCARRILKALGFKLLHDTLHRMRFTLLDELPEALQQTTSHALGFPFTNKRAARAGDPAVHPRLDADELFSLVLLRLLPTLGRPDFPNENQETPPALRQSKGPLAVWDYDYHLLVLEVVADTADADLFRVILRRQR